MTKILIVEDEEAISNLIRMSLQKAGYSCEQAMDGESAADRIAEHTYDLVLLDIMLPGMNGYELLNYIKTTNMPVIFITAMGTLDDKVKGLKAGADDYITKPFEMVELLARVESVLRRYHKSEERIEIDDVIIDIPSRTVTRQGEAVKLTLKEFELLLFLVRNRNIALYRETIYENIWQSEYMGDGRTVDLHIQRLRKKLHWEDRIHTVYKVGYRFT
mgnify:FL=1|jgi:two-component system alkaline phosphatase synthesis response regulator PhoP